MSGLLLVATELRTFEIGSFAPEMTCRAFINEQKWSLVIE